MKLKIWDREDDKTFGELFLIVGAVLITKYLDKLIPDSASWIIYWGIGFLFILWGARLTNRSEK